MFYSAVLAAVRGTTAANVAAAAPLIPKSGWRDNGGWVYWAGSAWVAMASEISAAAAKSAFPLLVAESRPSGVAVQIAGAGAQNDAEPFLWHWGLLSPARVKELEARYRTVKDLMSRGDYGVSKAAQKKVKAAAFADACRFIFEDETAVLAHALAKAGFCDASALEAVLLKLTPAELEWPVGGFPRLLEALGLSGIFPNYSQALSGEALVSSIDEVAPMLAAVPEPVAIEGGPLKLALADLPAFAGTLALFNTESRFGMRLTGAGKVSRAAFQGVTHHLYCSDDTVTYALGGDEWRMRNSAPILAELAPAIRSAAGLEIAGVRLGRGAGGVRFAGPIKGDVWQLEKSWPAVRDDVLADMLVLGRAGRGEGPVVIHSEEEIAAIQTKMKWNQSYFKGIVRNGNNWTVAAGASPEFLAQVVCGIRYGDFGAAAK